MTMKFKFKFKDGAIREVQAPTYSSGKVLAAYRRVVEEDELMHKALTIDEKASKELNRRKSNS